MGSSLGAGAEAQMTCDHTRRLSSILKAQTPQPQPQRAFQNPVPGRAVHDSETQCHGVGVGGKRGTQETTPNHFLCPLSYLRQRSSVQQLLSTCDVPTPGKG